MRSKFAVILIMVFAFTMLLGVTSALAWEKGKVKIEPSFKTELQYDSNVFYDRPGKEKGDIITVLTPAIAAEYNFGPYAKHAFRTDYKVDCGIFGRFDTQNYGNHDVFGELDLDLNKFKVKANDRFLFTSSRAGTEFEARNIRKENHGNVIVSADYNKFSADLGYNSYVVQYHSDLLQDLNRFENAVWTTGYYQVMPKTKALVEFEYRNIQYNEATGRNGNSFAGWGGLQGQIAPKLVGTIKAGYKGKIYNTGSGNKDFTNAVAYVDLSYDPIERTNIFFSYLRDGIESIYAPNNFYIADHFVLEGSHKFPQQWFGGFFKAKADGTFDLNQYPQIRPGDSDKRQDMIWSAGAGIEYQWKKYLTFDIGYKFQQRESNINTRDYNDNLVMGSVKAQF